MDKRDTDKRDIWLDGMMGLIVGDALGVPVEFLTREELKKNPVKGMRAYGTHNQPAGTWSDDSSMALATLDSIHINKGINAYDLMNRFSDWCLHGAYTPFQENFDIGISTSRAIIRYGKGADPFECGGVTEQENGNGSLMRILPICLYLYEIQKKVCTSENEIIYILHRLSALTHGHIRSQMACGIYYFLVKSILDEDGILINRLQQGMNRALSYYRQDFRNHAELGHYDRLNDLYNLKMTLEDEISSSGYVVHTLEASIWCLLNTDSFKDAVLKAVNLGDDTDTVAAVTGGLAGLYYGYAYIPSEWLDVIQKREWIERLILNCSGDKS